MKDIKVKELIRTLERFNGDLPILLEYKRATDYSNVNIEFVPEEIVQTAFAVKMVFNDKMTYLKESENE